MPPAESLAEQHGHEAHGRAGEGGGEDRVRGGKAGQLRHEPDAGLQQGPHGQLDPVHGGPHDPVVDHGARVRGGAAAQAGAGHGDPADAVGDRGERGRQQLALPVCVDAHQEGEAAVGQDDRRHQWLALLQLYLHALGAAGEHHAVLEELRGQDHGDAREHGDLQGADRILLYGVHAEEDSGEEAGLQCRSHGVQPPVLEGVEQAGLQGNAYVAGRLPDLDNL
mmetsp:Transcript_35838/g.102998  ORF Transcript_35838/g.102998 Transcript_35838/m.102998 type:complete len:223 (+) Transcript_35838:2-670(+)